MIKLTTKIGFLEGKITERDYGLAKIYLFIIDSEICQTTLEVLKKGLQINCGVVRVDNAVLYTDFIITTLAAAGWNASVKYTKISDDKIDLTVFLSF